MTILDQLADHARERVRAAKAILPPEELRRRALALPKGDFAFERALGRPGVSFICECKKASPSKGLIAPEFPYLEIAKEYEAAGADCVSVLTEPKWFLGSDEYLREIAEAVSIPCLRKDFTVDDYMIYQAKLLGTSAVLLICSILTPQQLQAYIGVNNRNLKDFTVDTGNSSRLRALVPTNVLFVAESGVRDAGDVKRLRESGADAVLVGEALMRAADKRAKLAELRGEV